LPPYIFAVFYDLINNRVEKTKPFIGFEFFTESITHFYDNFIKKTKGL